MSEPNPTGTTMRELMAELTAADSSLNMEPTPIKEPDGKFLSDMDYWAAHAQEHILAAFQIGKRIIDGQRPMSTASLLTNKTPES